MALLYVMFSCAFVTVPYSVLGQVWCLIVSIPDLCLRSLFGFCQRNFYIVTRACVQNVCFTVLSFAK